MVGPEIIESRTRLEDRITRTENDIDRLGERLATSLQSVVASVATLQQSQARHDTKLDHIVELQNEARNTTGAIERLGREIAEMNAENKAKWTQNSLEVDRRWEQHRRDIEVHAKREAESTLARVKEFTDWRRGIDDEMIHQGKKISNWTFGGSLLTGILGLVILPLAIWSYRSDIATGNEDRSQIKSVLVQHAATIRQNSDRIRAIELYNAKDPAFIPEGIKR